MSQVNSESNLPALHTPSARGVSAFQSTQTFEDAQRMAKALASSSMVPKEYQGRLDNCLVALELANRTGASVLAVMQSVDMIHGRPSWKSTYIISAVNSCGRFTPLRFRMSGEGVKRSCVAYATDKDTGELVEGPMVSMEMAKAEGWIDKAGSKWKTMPDLMLRYRAATFFGRLYASDVLLGMQTDDELRDVTPPGSFRAAAPSAVEKVNSKVRSKRAASVVIDASPVTVEGPDDTANGNAAVEEESHKDDAHPDGNFF